MRLLLLPLGALGMLALALVGLGGCGVYLEGATDPSFYDWWDDTDVGRPRYGTDWGDSHLIPSPPPRDTTPSNGGGGTPPPTDPPAANDPFGNDGDSNVPLQADLTK